jgi:adenine phosphoribosyltransferase
MSLEKYIRDIQDFPKEGIMFKDITSLIDAQARKKSLDLWLRVHQIKGSIKDRSREPRIFLFWHIASAGIECGFYKSVLELTNCLTKPSRQLMI